MSEGPGRSRHGPSGVRPARPDDAGFTLVELLIVIVILGIVAAIVIFAVGTARVDSVTSACKADVKTVNTAAEAYKAEHGRYPDKNQLTSGGDDAVLKSFPESDDYEIEYSDGIATGHLGTKDKKDKDKDKDKGEEC